MDGLNKNVKTTQNSFRSLKMNRPHFCIAVFFWQNYLVFSVLVIMIIVLLEFSFVFHQKKNPQNNGLSQRKLKEKPNKQSI